MYSEFPGFRRSVRQSGSGWNVRVAGRKGFMRRYAWLSEQVFLVKAGEAASQVIQVLRRWRMHRHGHVLR